LPASTATTNKCANENASLGQTCAKAGVAIFNGSTYVVYDDNNMEPTYPNGTADTGPMGLMGIVCQAQAYLPLVINFTAIWESITGSYFVPPMSTVSTVAPKEKRSVTVATTPKPSLAFCPASNFTSFSFSGLSTDEHVESHGESHDFDHVGTLTDEIGDESDAERFNEHYKYLRRHKRNGFASFVGGHHFGGFGGGYFGGGIWQCWGHFNFVEGLASLQENQFGLKIHKK